MLAYQDIVHMLREVSRNAYRWDGYAINSIIVAGSSHLAELIDSGLFPAENCHWIAKSIVPDLRTFRILRGVIHRRFDAMPAGMMSNLLCELFVIARDYQPEREGIPNPDFQRIFTQADMEFSTFFPNDTDDFDNEAHREILAQGGATDSDSDEDYIGIEEEDINSEDDFIDPENPPEYELYPAKTAPRYEDRNRDTLLDAGLPLYSEFSWIRTMLCRVQSLA